LTDPRRRKVVYPLFNLVTIDRAAGKSAIHIVSAWASANHIRLRQVVVDEKRNEITAIPKLLQVLELSGAFVTIDAMGCQVEIARAIVDAGGDYVLAGKNDQPTVVQAIDAYFAEHAQDNFARVEVRRHLTNDKKLGIKNKRLLAAPNGDYLQEVLFGT
jgi:predicted transposase YbfD/YdcC